MTTQTVTRILYARCTSPGYLLLNTQEPFIRTDETGRETVDWFANTGMAFYKFRSAEALHTTASRYDWIIQRNRKMRGENYTLAMAQKDFEEFAS